LTAFNIHLSRNLTQDEEKILGYLLDNAATGAVNQDKFSEFLKAFGPMKSNISDCIKNMKLILREKWFHGFLSKTESEQLLQNQESGTFLIRFSKSKVGSFAIAFTAGTSGKVYHIMINSCKPIGFKVYENETKQDRTFRDLNEVVKAYSYALITPLMSSIQYERWFQGDLTSVESAEMLHDQPIGTFLIRFSGSQVGNYAATFINFEKHIKHMLIQKIPGNRFQLDTEEGPRLIFHSMTEVVAHYKKLGVFKVPLPNPASEVNEIIQKWTNEVASFESSIDAIFSNISE